MPRGSVILVTLLVLLCRYAPTQKEKKIDRVNDEYVLSLGDISLRVSAEKGGRILSLKRKNKELLTSDSINAVYYGATCWISPQADYWPQYPNVDQLPYQAEIEGDVLRLTSTTIPASSICITKEFSISEKDTAILINYHIRNISDKPQNMAPWDVARVQGGITFFPVGEADVMNRSNVENANEEEGIMKFQITGNRNKKGQKLFSTGRAGWLAHYDNGLLFVKCFPDIRPEEVPPGQGEVEIYVAPEGSYLELENHGKYAELQPGQSITYRQKWFLIEVPDRREKEWLSVIEKLDKKTDWVRHDRTKYSIIFIGNSITYGATLDTPQKEAPPVEVARNLQEMGYEVKYANCGYSGSTTVDFLPASNNLFSKVEQAADSLYSPDSQLIFSIMLGTNDSAIEGPTGAPISPENYRKNLQAIIDSLHTKYPESHFVLHRPLWYSPNTHNKSLYLKEGLKRLQTYTPMMDMLIKESPDYIFKGDRDAYSFFEMQHKEYVTAEEGNSGIFFLHPNVRGAKVLGKYWTDSLIEYIYRQENR